MASIGQRIFAFTMATVFLISACAFSAFVIYDMSQSRKKSASQKAAQAQSQTQAQTPPPSANALAGKPLEGFQPVEKIAALEKNDTKPGEGVEAKASDTVSVDYTGAVAATGIVFQSSKDTGSPATLSLSSVIEGWKEGIPGMKEGGTRRLLIPAEQAYGANPPQGSNIPANADLVFDVTLVKVNPPKQQ